MSNKTSVEGGEGTVPSQSIETKPTPELSADRELDAAIAVRVMGWTLVENSGAAGGRYWQGHGGSFGDMGESDLPSFSTEIAAAMQVVEKMRADGWSFACTLYEGKLPYASFCKQTVASSRNAEAATLAEAISRAALQATSGFPSTTVE